MEGSNNAKAMNGKYPSKKPKLNELVQKETTKKHLVEEDPSDSPSSSSVDWDTVQLNVVEEQDTDSKKPSNGSVYVRTSMFLIDGKHTWDCPLCKSTFIRKLSFVKHLTLNHRNDGMCRICSKSYTSLTVMMEHMFLDHNSDSSKCCGVTYYTPVRLSRHISQHHYKPPLNVNDVVNCTHNRDWCVICTLCWTGFTYRTNLYQHIHSVHDIAVEDVFKVVIAFKMLHYKRVYTCSQCPKVSLEKLQHTKYACSRFRDKYSLYTSFCSMCPRQHNNGYERIMEIPHVFSMKHRPYFELPPFFNIGQYLDNKERKTCVCSFIGGHMVERLHLECSFPDCSSTFKRISNLTKHFILVHCSRESTEIRIECNQKDYTLLSVAP